MVKLSSYACYRRHTVVYVGSVCALWYIVTQTTDVLLTLAYLIIATERQEGLRLPIVELNETFYWHYIDVLHGLIPLCVYSSNWRRTSKGFHNDMSQLHDAVDENRDGLIWMPSHWSQAPAYYLHGPSARV